MFSRKDTFENIKNYKLHKSRIDHNIHMKIKNHVSFPQILNENFNYNEKFFFNTLNAYTSR
jgi:hypothetical protein